MCDHAQPAEENNHHFSSQGKGIMTTYWLEGQDGFTRPLPTKDMAVSESQHEFK